MGSHAASPSEEQGLHRTVWSEPPKRPAGRTKVRETRHPVYRGVRRRGQAGAGRWVCEVRMFSSRTLGGSRPGPPTGRLLPITLGQLFAFDTAKKFLTPKADQSPKTPFPPSLVAGALAGVSSTLCTYPLELIKTRLTIEKDVYANFLHCFVKILREEGPSELYRGLTPSLIGVVPYAATNYYAYDTLRKLYRKTFKQEEISNIATLLIGSAAGAISSTATFPLEVARKQMQVGAVGGRQVYKNVFHALYCIMEKEGIGGLYKGLGPSCIKLMPAAGISFMCYEACKKILVEAEE